MTEIPTIDPSMYSVDLKREPLQVAESRLYKGVDRLGNEVAIKIYRDIPLRQIQLYQQITNDLARRHNKNRFIELEFGGKIHKMLIHIVPIDGVGLVKGSAHPCTISSFIEGNTLFGIEPHYISSRYDKLKEDPLVTLGSEFRSETGTNNISIIPWNVKPIPNQHPKILAITDITGSVSELRKE